MTGREARTLVARYDAATYTASVTGRRIFGQLWIPDPPLDTFLRGIYQDALADALSCENPLQQFLGKQG